MSDFSELEAELRNLRPVSMSPALLSRIARELASGQTPSAGVVPRPRPRLRINWLLLGLGLPVAAAFLVLARTQIDRAPTKQPAVATNALAPAQMMSVPLRGQLRPAGMSQVVYGTRDEGLLFAEGAKRPVRRVRTEARETLHWRDPGTGAFVRVSYPREEVSLIPISGQ